MKNGDVSSETLWNLLLVLAVLALAGAFVYDKITPHPSVAYHASQGSAAELDQAHKISKESKERVDSKLWDLDAQELSSSVLAHVTAIAEKSQVQLADFRNEKTLSVSGVTEAPFLVVLDGDFKDVMKVIGILEANDSKLGLGLCQFATSDRGPGFVKATVSLTAFQQGGPSHPRDL